MGKGFLRVTVVLLAGILVFLLMVCFARDGEDPVVTTSDSTASSTTQPPATQQTAGQTVTTAPTTQPESTPAVPVISPDVVGIYIPAGDGTAARRHITEFSAPRTPKVDIDCFEVLASREETVQGTSFKSIWNGAWEAYPDGKDSKIGFHLEFTLTDGRVVSKTLLKPSDSREFYDYLEVYLYDDIHQSGWYSHLEDQDMTEETVISSIKLTSGSRIGEVGDIFLTAFLYTGEDCFDGEGNYIGGVEQTIKITP